MNNDAPNLEDYDTEEAYDDAVDYYLARQALDNPRFKDDFRAVFGGDV